MLFYLRFTFLGERQGILARRVGVLISWGASYVVCRLGEADHSSTQIPEVMSNVFEMTALFLFHFYDNQRFSDIWGVVVIVKKADLCISMIYATSAGDGGGMIFHWVGSRSLNLRKDRVGSPWAWSAITLLLFTQADHSSAQSEQQYLHTWNVTVTASFSLQRSATIKTTSFITGRVRGKVAFLVTYTSQSPLFLSVNLFFM